MQPALEPARFSSCRRRSYTGGFWQHAPFHQPFSPIRSSRISWQVGKHPFHSSLVHQSSLFFSPRRIGTRIYERTENRNAISCAGGAQGHSRSSAWMPRVHCRCEQIIRVLLPFAAQGNFNQTKIGRAFLNENPSSAESPRPPQYGRRAGTGRMRMPEAT